MSDEAAAGLDPPPLHVNIGINLPAKYGVSDKSVVENALEQGYDMVTSRLTSRSYRKRIQALFHELEQTTGSSNAMFFSEGAPPSPGQSPDLCKPEPTGSLVEAAVPAPELDDVVVHPGPHVSNTIALAAPWVEIDSKNPRVASLSLQVLKHEFSYATFCDLPYIVISGPKRRTNVIQYSQALNTLLAKNPLLRVSIHLPLTEEFTSSPAGFIPPADYFSIWEVWNTIRCACNYPPNLSVALQLPKHSLPSKLISRWFAEPVSMLIVSSRTFISNPKGFPVLPKYSQAILHQFFKKNPFLVIEDPQDAAFEGGEIAFLAYLRHLCQRTPPPTVLEEFATGYTDFLQAPLQPLIDNLDSSMYETFERDPVKYNQYEKAIFHALMDRSAKEAVLAVVGAGRGPLVDRALKAAVAANRTVKIYAVEKNDSAYVYLQRRKAQEWGSAVELMRTDMRNWAPPQKVDIIISELLGSFGDNELSPECLDGVQSILGPDGVMIPSSYSAHFTPVFAPKLYSSVWGVGTTNKQGYQAVLTSPPRPGTCSSHALQAPYVVMLHQVDFLSEKIRQAWKFCHPVAERLADNQHNIRKTKETFAVLNKSVMHGIAGYFEAVLYKDVQLSTRPDTIDEKSKDMVSWFPIWFPLTDPLYVADDSEIDISMWRLTDGRKVWYEWSVEAFALIGLSVPGRTSNTVRRIRTGSTILHNSEGQHSSMQL
jgi:protein arginine N-methyltransferase 5